MGAWSTAGRPLAQVLPEAVTTAMQAQLAAGAGRCEHRSGPLWLLAGSGRLSSDGPLHVACEGSLAGAHLSPRGVAAALEHDDAESGWSRLPDGHYVLACADAARGRLALLRGLSGGERLFVLRAAGVVLFASSIRPLLASGLTGRALDRSKLREAALTGMTLFGTASLVEGVEEVLAGHVLRLGGEARAQRWYFPALLRPLHGDPATLAGGFREALTRAVEQCIGPHRPVAVTLSGGIDSSAVAAAAVDVVGAGAVRAYTYEFDDRGHPSEARFAGAAARRLGIRDHRTFPIRFHEFLDDIPETVWRAESPAHWPKAFMLQAARRIRDDGFDRFLSGFGVGSHMGYFEDLARALAPLPRRVRALLHHGRQRWVPRLGAGALERLHPALAAANPRLLYLLAGVLGAPGPGADPARLYGRDLRPLFALLDGSPRIDEQFRGMDLADQLRHQSFAHLVSCIDVTRWEKPLRELGCARLSPAHVATTIPYAYMPYLPRPRLWTGTRALRPGKHLLQLAYRDRLPEQVLYRRKSWADAVVSRQWLAAGVRWMRRVVPEPWQVLAPRTEDERRAASRWDLQAPQAAITALAFWQRVLVERPPSPRPPCWEELLA